MSENEVVRPRVWLPSRGIKSHQALYRELTARIDSLHLEPGDLVTVTFPRELYDDDHAFRDAQRFVQQLAQVLKMTTGRTHEVVMLKDGTEIEARKQPGPIATFEMESE